MSDVAIFFKIDEKAQELLKKNQISFSLFDGIPSSKEIMSRQLKDAKVVVTFPGQKFDKRYFELIPNLKLLIVHGSGLDSIDIEAATERKICVANSPDSIAEAVAEHVLALTISSLRYVVEGDKIIRNGKWVRGIQRSLTGRSLKGIKVGIIGLGRIGSETARIFSALGSHVTYWDRKRKPELEHALKIDYMDLRDLLSTSDVVIVSIALTESTRKLIGKNEVFMLKRGALLVNVSRGAIIDEDSLIERLKSGEIRAALDVFENEPIGNEHPLTQLSNVVLTPHIAGLTEEALTETSIFVANSIIEFLKKGRLPYTTVNMSSCI